ncbi:MAG TPA: TolC family protein [Gemmatimonadaceae bacterium]|nr:TolC family protein [Gemmatimonadaceae bacterium]
MLRPTFAFVAATAFASATNVAAQQSTAPLPSQLTLPAAIEYAKQHGARARAARFNLESARENFRAFSARQKPQAFLSGDVPSYNRLIIPAPQPDGSVEFRPQQQTNSSLNLFISQGVPITGGSVSLISQLAQLRRTGAAETWQSTPFSLNLTQPILRSNALSWDRAEQSLGAELAERTYREAMEDVAGSTATAFVAVYSARETMRNATENLRRNELLREKVQTRLRLSAVSTSDARRIELGYLQAQQSVSQATLARDEADANFRAALGLAANTPFDVVLPGEPPALAPDSTQAVSIALRNRSESIQHELSDTRARRQISRARFDGGIGATITASYGYNATALALGDVYQDLQDRQTFRLNVQMPVWQWGAGGADREAAHAARSASTAIAQDQRDQITRDVMFAIRRLAQARYGFAIAMQADTVAADALQDALVRYDFGGVQIENLFLALTGREQAAQQRIASIATVWNEYYRVRRVTMYDFESGRPIR